VLLDLRRLSPVTDYFLLCTGTSDRQVRSVADHVDELAKTRGVKRIGRDGYETANWVLMDFVDLVVHIFSPEYRRIYDLELLWGDAKKVRWQRRAGRSRNER